MGSERIAIVVKLRPEVMAAVPGLLLEGEASAVESVRAGAFDDVTRLAPILEVLQAIVVATEVREGSPGASAGQLVAAGGEPSEAPKKERKTRAARVVGLVGCAVPHEHKFTASGVCDLILNGVACGVRMVEVGAD